jgi:hypothetical protein
MSKPSSFSKQPPKSLEEFVAGAGQPAIPVSQTSGADPMPWDGLQNTKQTEFMNLRLTAQLKAKLAFVAENSKYTQNAYMTKILESVIDQDIERLLRGENLA